MKLSTVSDDGEVLRLRASGRITQEHLPPRGDVLGDLLGSGGYGRPVVLSLAEIDFIDTSGISWLLGRHRQFRQTGGRLVLHSLVPVVGEALKVLRLNVIFHVADDEPAALDLVRKTLP